MAPCVILSPKNYQIVAAILVFVVVCYGKTLKHLMASRCTSIRLFGCVACDRTPLSDEAAMDVVESPETIDINVGGPAVHVRSFTL
jgi:hypothetical protein